MIYMQGGSTDEGTRKTGQPHDRADPVHKQAAGRSWPKLPGKCSAALYKLQPRPASDRKAMTADWKVTDDDMGR